MLYLITGRIGSGKTSLLHDLIGQFAANGERGMMLIVPEQFSFATERMMLSRLGAAGLSAVDVLSFSRLADKLVPRAVCESKKMLDEASEAALMGIALSGVRDRLELYSKQIDNPSVIRMFLSMTAELKQSRVTTDMLREARLGMEEGRLKRKLNDISLVADAYCAQQAQSWFDASDKLDYLCAELEANNPFEGRLVFVDGFRGFTAQELKILEHMLVAAKTVYVTLSMEKPGAVDCTDLFAYAKITENKLKRLAGKNNVGIVKPQNLSMGSKYNNFPRGIKRFESAQLAALEKNLFDMAAPIYDGECSDIAVCSAPDVYSECDFVAATAKKLIRESGYRCRDIAVIARNSESYEAPLRAALKKNGLSVFEDKRQPIAASPLISLVEAVTAVAAEGFQSENVMRFLKTGLTEISAEEISVLENYVYLWQINGSKWLGEWKLHPRGYGFPFTQDDYDELESLNAVRERALAPLIKFRKKVELASGEEAARAIYDLLCDIKADERLKELAVALNGQNDAALALEQERLWDSLMNLLDSLVSVAGERKFGVRELKRVLELMLRTQTLGTIPNGLDEIILGSADRIRVISPRAVFIVGANYGVFPAVGQNVSALNDKDRQALAQLNIELSAFGEYKLAEERLIAYSAFCCAGEKLFVCYPNRDGKGTLVEPSELVTRIEKLFPGCRRLDAAAMDGMFFVESKKTAFEQLAREKSADTPLYRALYEYFRNDAEYAGRLAALERAASAERFEIRDKAAAQRLFGKSMYLSASRAEKYYKCPFEYFCEYGMKASPRKTAQIDVLQRGTIIHYVLEKLLQKYKGDSLLTLKRRERFAEIIAVMQVYLDEMLGGTEGKSPRFMRNYRLIAQTVNDIAERLVAEFSVCAFRPIDFELKIGSGEDCDIPPYELRLPDEGELKVHGSIDRVDCAVINGEKYIRVIDYKSGGKDFALSDVLNGLNMQMLIYLFAVWENSGERYGEITPAGVLYYPAKTPPLTAERSIDGETVLAEKTKRCSMKGIVLNDTGVVLAMDSNACGAYIPAKFNPKKNLLEGSLITLSQLSQLRRKADSLLTEMANSLKDGKIEALPVRSDNYKDVCKYCEYKAVCFYDENREYRELEKITNAEVLNMLDGEVRQDG